MLTMRDARKRDLRVRAVAILTALLVLSTGVPAFSQLPGREGGELAVRPSSDGDPGPWSSAAPGRPVSPLSGDYTLGTGDVLNVSVWGHPDLTSEVIVGPDGKITLPLAGPVSAAGTTVDQLRVIITNAYKNYIISPQVIVGIKTFRKLHAATLGQVTRPGAYDLEVGARVLDLIAAAGGLTDAAALNRARLVRASGDNQPIDLDALLLHQDMSANVALKPGDTIFIPEDTNKRVFVIGDVKNPGVFPLKGSVTMLQAIAMAGGPDPKGAGTAKTAYIVRRGGGDNAQPIYASVGGVAKADNLPSGGTLITANLAAIMHDPGQDVVVQPGDVVMVPQSNLGGLQFIVSILSGISSIFRGPF